MIVLSVFLIAAPICLLVALDNLQTRQQRKRWEAES